MIMAVAWKAPTCVEPFMLSRVRLACAEQSITGPRLHGFRHRFALKTLIHWYRSGEDIERRLPVLSTFLGDAHAAATYWYLSIHPELMGLATERLEQQWGADS
jgi:integrase/recombinase XerD